MFGCDGISDHASRNEVFHLWDIKLSWTMNVKTFSTLHIYIGQGQRSRTFVKVIGQRHNVKKYES